MPNHITNEVIFDRPVSEHQAILDATYGDSGAIDFERLIPMPPHIWRGSVSIKDEAAFGKQNIGLDWARANWGTKWNAYSSLPAEADEATLTLRFQTAWSPPYPWLVALLNTFGGFRHNWLGEGSERGVSGQFIGEGDFGPEWKEQPADEALHRHLHKLLWGVEQFEDEKA